MSQIISSSVMRMTSIEISDLVGSRHGSVKRAIERLATPKDDGTPAVIQLPPMVQVENNQSLSPNSRSKAYLFQGEQGRRDSIVVVAQLSPEFTARLVDRWQELESQQAKQPTPQIVSPLEEDLRGIAFIADSMRLPDSGKLRMFTKYCQTNAPRLLPTLPAYAIDAPTGSTTGSSEATSPIREIVKGLTSAIKANKALQCAGLLEQKFRPSTNDTQKAYWSVTEAGLAFGKNASSPKNDRETQPHWYQSKAGEIRKIIQENLSRLQ